jgi:hypothetical protein
LCSLVGSFFREMSRGLGTSPPVTNVIHIIYAGATIVFQAKELALFIFGIYTICATCPLSSAVMTLNTF